MHAFLWSAATGVMTDLGVPPGQTSSEGYGVNSHGDVVGVAGQQMFYKPFGGPFVLLGKGIASRINDNGVVAGTRAPDGNMFRWTQGTGMEVLTNYGGVAVYGINARGDVLGSHNPYLFFAPFEASTATVLTSPIANGFIEPGGSSSISRNTTMNDAGVVIGGYTSPYKPDGTIEVHPFKWTAAGGFVDLGTIPGGGVVGGKAWAINNAGDIVGGNFVDHNYWATRGFIVNSCGMSDLPPFPGDELEAGAQAEFITDTGVVAGHTGYYGAAVWENGVPRRIRDSLPPGSTFGSNNFDVRVANGNLIGGVACQIDEAGNFSCSTWAMLVEPVPPATDTDCDGTPDDQDAFPGDAGETSDRDDDGVGDTGDAFPDDAGETRDSDGDGVGDNGDAYPNDPCNNAAYFSDGLTGPGSPCLSIPSNKYSYTPTGLLRAHSDSGPNNGIDRPMVKTTTAAYLTTDFAFELDIQIPQSASDIAYIGFGEGVPNPNYSNEPTNAFLFRIHRMSDGYRSIDAAVVRAANGPFAYIQSVGQYVTGQRTTFRIEKRGDTVTMSVPSIPGSSRTFSITTYAPFLNSANARLFFGNTAEGTVYSNFSVTELPPLDADGDGTPDTEDAFPNDPNETTDRDGDGVGDNGDAFPEDARETTDSDGDGVGDNSDAFPNDAGETTDSDGDGVGDNGDAFPNDGAETKDSDGDGVGDNADAFDNDPTETRDTDGDGVGDNRDLYPNDPSASANLVIAGKVTSVPARNGAQLILTAGETSCGGGSAKNHGQYNSCVGQVLNAMKKQGLITDSEKGLLQSIVAQSSVGKK